jgi:predicted AlkP superfamily pyrophosphatase or phosphodiesterase
MPSKLLIIDVAALGWDFLTARGLDQACGLWFRPARAPFPAVTCTAQADFRTQSPPRSHGMVANGRYFPQLAKVLFWEQSARLVQGRRFWHRAREEGKRVGMLFWQQSLGEQVDLVLSPAPIHKHHGGMIQDCYCQPDDLYPRLCQAIGGRFKLQHYWGPFASAKVGDWIAQATACVMEQESCDLLLTYLPTLDYDLQRRGPESPQADKALGKLFEQLSLCIKTAGEHDYEVLVFGDYAIAPARGQAIYPNRHLLDRGWFKQRTVAGMSYPDFHASRALALVDHEIAHVYVRDQADVGAVRDALRELPGLGSVLTMEEIAQAGLDHPNAGQLVLVAQQGRWLAYPWWSRQSKPPDYARHIDIHNKPGFDPCELMLGWPPGVTTNTARICGTHGCNGPGRQIAWASTAEIDDAEDLIQLSQRAQEILES